jgi:hypothetical protein
VAGERSDPTNASRVSEQGRGKLRSVVMRTAILLAGVMAGAYLLPANEASAQCHHGGGGMSGMSMGGMSSYGSMGSGSMGGYGYGYSPMAYQQQMVAQQAMAQQQAAMAQAKQQRAQNESDGRRRLLAEAKARDARRRDQLNQSSQYATSLVSSMGK